MDEQEFFGLILDYLQNTSKRFDGKTLYHFLMGFQGDDFILYNGETATPFMVRGYDEKLHAANLGRVYAYRKDGEFYLLARPVPAKNWLFFQP